MKKQLLKTLCFLLFSTTVYAHEGNNCSIKRAELEKNIHDKYKVDYLRALTRTVDKNLEKSEYERLIELSTLFNSISHDTPEHQNLRIKYQLEAKDITQAVAVRSGFKLIDPTPDSPFDALIEEVNSSDDGYVEYDIELRDLLVLPTPLPHVTIWLQRRDTLHNPYSIINYGIMPDSKEDYISWRDSNSKRVFTTFDEFIYRHLPAECQ